MTHIHDPLSQRAWVHANGGCVVKQGVLALQFLHISGVTSHKCKNRIFQVSQVTSAIIAHFRCHKSQVQLRDLCFVCVAGRHLTYRALYACTTCETWSELLLGVPRSLSSHTRLERPLKPSLILYAWQGVMTLTRPLL